MIKRILACLLALIMLIPVSACKKEDYAVKYDNTSINEGMYEYMYASLKRYYLDTFDDIRDNPSAWAEKVSDEYTYAEYVDMKIRETINIYVICAELYDGYGYSISSEGQKMLNDEFAAAVEYFGSEDKLATSLGEDFGMTVDELRGVYEIQYKYERIMYDSGIVQVEDADRDRFYEERYIRAGIIYIGTKLGYKKDEDGKLILNGSSFETYELSAEQKAAKKALADDVQAKIKSGELSFEDAYKDEDINEFDIANYPNGIYFGRDNYTKTNLSHVAEAAFAIEIGEVTRVSDENGEFIIYRQELPEKAYDSAEDYIQFSDLDELCARNKFDERMKELSRGVETNEAVIEKYSVTDISPVSY